MIVLSPSKGTFEAFCRDGLKFLTTIEVPSHVLIFSGYTMEQCVTASKVFGV